MNRPTDPRMRNEEPSNKNDKTADMYKLHIETVEKECSDLFADYMNHYNQDPSSENTKSALEKFNARYDHLKKLQGVLEPENDTEQSHVRVKEESVPVKEEPAPPSLIDPKKLVFLQLKDDDTEVEKKRKFRTYKTSREFCDDFEAMLMQNGLILHDWEKALPLCLNRDDLEWFEKNLENRKYPWKDARQMLIDHKQTNVARMYMMIELCHLRQSATESTGSYGYRFQKLCKEAHIKDGTMLAAQFLVSLRETVRQPTISAIDAGESVPRSLDDMVKFVLEHDKSEKQPYGAKRSYERDTQESSNKKSRRIFPCRWCGKPFVPSHKCQEYYDHKNATR